MVFTPDKTAASVNALQQAQDAYQNLTTDAKLGLLWVVYDHMGGSLTPAAPGATEAQFTKQLIAQVKAMKHEAQLEFMRDLIDKKETELTQAYSNYTKDNKLVFWYELAQLMETGDVVPVPDAYELPTEATQVFNQIVLLDFNEQITLLRHCVMDMGQSA